MPQWHLGDTRITKGDAEVTQVPLQVFASLFHISGRMREDILRRRSREDPGAT